MEATGKIIAILPANSGVSQRTGNPWCTQTFVLETIEQYPKKIPFEVFGEDRIRQFNLQMGETVTIHFDVDGREYNGRWYPSVKCFNVVRQGQQQVAVTQQQTGQVQQPTPAPQPQVAAPSHTSQDEGDGNTDDLPF
jgi:hypothetical protein